MSFLSFGKVRSAAMSTLNSGMGGTLPIAIDFGAGSLKLLQLVKTKGLAILA